MVLTKEELDDQDWLSQYVASVENNPAADGEGSPSVLLYFHFLFQTPHIRPYSPCLLGHIM